MERAETDNNDFEKIKERLQSNKPGESVYLTDKIITQPIDFTNSKNETIYFTNVEFLHDVVISKINPEAVIDFHCCTFKGSIQFINIQACVLRINNCSGSKLSFFNTSIAEFRLHDNRIDSVSISKSKLTDCFISSEGKSQIKVSNLLCDDFKINLWNKDSDLSLIIADTLSSDPEEVDDELIPTVIQKLTLSYAYSSYSSIKFFNIRINHIYLIGNFVKGELEFDLVKTRIIEIDKFINAAIVKFSTLHFYPGSILKIAHSDTGKMSVININFTVIESIFLSTSTFSESNFSGVTWCSRINEKEKKMSALQLRETYRQLKNINSKNGDKPSELTFYALEMDSYLKVLKLQKDNSAERIILLFNKFTNNHGQSWVRPLAMIFLIIVLIYFPIKVLLGYTTLNLSLWSSTLTEMIECLNPLRKFSDSFGLQGTVKQNSRTNLAWILDFIFLKVFIGLLLFQTVKAFRKYIR